MFLDMSTMRASWQKLNYNMCGTHQQPTSTSYYNKIPFRCTRTYLEVYFLQMRFQHFFSSNVTMKPGEIQFYKRAQSMGLLIPGKHLPSHVQCARVDNSYTFSSYYTTSHGILFLHKHPMKEARLKVHTKDTCSLVCDFIGLIPPQIPIYPFKVKAFHVLESISFFLSFSLSLSIMMIQDTHIHYQRIHTQEKQSNTTFPCSQK